MSANKRGERLGQRFIHPLHGEYEVVDYKNSLNVVVRFDRTGYTTKATYASCLVNEIKDPLTPTVFGVGFIGIGCMKTTNGVGRRLLRVWTLMLRRCYDKQSDHYPYYGDRGVTVCDEWHNFQNFARWYLDQSNFNINYQVDKDLRVAGSKVYSPETCSLVPSQVNSVLARCGGLSGTDNPMLGIQYIDRLGKFRVAVGDGVGGGQYRGLCATLEAAQNLYCKIKNERVQEVAEKYKEVLHPEVYNNLVNFKMTYLSEDFPKVDLTKYIPKELLNKEN